ncbi:MerR family transcriptional regulator [Streptomyces sp. NPDC005925]|uniref:MerR family transcriptional regulator n=1 Tax=Streptomyces sp. NPDC005925 TaxID=3157172 RepID=UPI003403E84A
MPELMVIGEFAALSRLSHKALRLYADKGLLEPAHVDPDTHVRHYLPSQLRQARLITLLRAVGMPLGLIGTVLLAEGERAAELVGDYWRTHDRDHRVRRPLVTQVQDVLRGRTTDTYLIEERETGEQRVVFVEGHVTAEGLPGFLDAATEELFGHLRAGGGAPSGPVFAVYHGLVDEDGDGPVQVCVPTEGPVEPGGRVGLRVEPAHRQAYTELRKGQGAYATVAGALDAVAAWLHGRGLRPSASAREIYYPDRSPGGRGPGRGLRLHEHVMDVAVPFATAV